LKQHIRFLIAIAICVLIYKRIPNKKIYIQLCKSFCGFNILIGSFSMLSFGMEEHHIPACLASIIPRISIIEKFKT